MNGLKLNGWVMFLVLAGLGIIASNLFRPAVLPAGQLPNGQMVDANTRGKTTDTVNSTTTTMPLAKNTNKSSFDDGNKNAADAALPFELERVLLDVDASKRNPFAAELPMPKVVKKVTVVAEPPPPVSIQASPQPPMMPALNLKFVGRVTEPNGNRVVFASLDENPVSLQIGQTLSNGFRVDAINDNAVELTYVSLGTTTRFDLPKPPIFDIR